MSETLLVCETTSAMGMAGRGVGGVVGVDASRVEDMAGQQEYREKERN